MTSKPAHSSRFLPTGNAGEAEDLVQETYLRYHASKGTAIVSLKAYLTTILTRLALDYLKSARLAREEPGGIWLPEPIRTLENDAFPQTIIEQQEALSLAVLRLRERLSPPERAVFLLHEIFEYSFRDIGMLLSKSPVNCRQIFHRARQALQEQRTRFDPPPRCQLLHHFLAASQAGDMEALTHLLRQMSSHGRGWWQQSVDESGSNLRKARHSTGLG